MEQLTSVTINMLDATHKLLDQYYPATAQDNSDIDIAEKGLVDKMTALGSKLHRRVVRSINTTAHGASADVGKEVSFEDLNKATKNLLSEWNENLSKVNDKDETPNVLLAKWMAKRSLGVLLSMNQVFAQSLPMVTSTSERLRNASYQVYDCTVRVPTDYTLQVYKNLSSGSVFEVDPNKSVSEQIQAIMLQMLSVIGIKEVSLGRSNSASSDKKNIRAEYNPHFNPVTYFNKPTARSIKDHWYHVQSDQDLTAKRKVIFLEDHLENLDNSVDSSSDVDSELDDDKPDDITEEEEDFKENYLTDYRFNDRSLNFIPPGQKIKVEVTPDIINITENDPEFLISDIDGRNSDQEPIISLSGNVTPLPELPVTENFMSSPRVVEHSEFIKDNKLLSGGSWRKVKLPGWITNKNKSLERNQTSTISPPLSSSSTPEKKRKSLKRTFSLRKNK